MTGTASAAETVEVPQPTTGTQLGSLLGMLVALLLVQIVTAACGQTPSASGAAGEAGRSAAQPCALLTAEEVAGLLAGGGRAGGMASDSAAPSPSQSPSTPVSAVRGTEQTTAAGNVACYWRPAGADLGTSEVGPVLRVEVLDRGVLDVARSMYPRQHTAVVGLGDEAFLDGEAALYVRFGGSYLYLEARGPDGAPQPQIERQAAALIGPRL